MADLLITNFRLSFIWTETLTNALSGASKPLPDFDFLTSNDRYSRKLSSVSDAAESSPFYLPWAQKKNHRFWHSYLPGAPLPNVSGKQAWKYLVPLGCGAIQTFQAATGETVDRECFIYPHGFGCVVSVKCAGEFTLSAVAERAMALYRGSYSRDSQSPMTLRNVTDQGLDVIRSQVYGTGQIRGPQSGPISVASLMKGKVTGEGAYRLPSGELQQVMEALSTWPADWKIPIGPGLSNASIPLSSKAGAGAIVYVRSAGRVIWIPEKILSEKPLSSIACYHQNQVFGCLQVESLGALVADVARDLRAGKSLSDLPIMLKACVRNAVDRLVELYQGEKRMTYRSAALERQITDTYMADLNDVRKQILPGVEDLK